MFRSYLRLLLFTLGLLVGLQVPGLVNDYRQRVEAHRLEAQHALSGFQQTADRFFNGDVQALLRHYRESPDPVFNSDAGSIDHLLTRNRLLEQEWQALQGNWLSQAWHVLVQPDPELRRETLAGYSYQVLLVPEAIGWGLAIGFLLAFLVESLLVLIGALLLGRRRGEVKESWR